MNSYVYLKIELYTPKNIFFFFNIFNYYIIKRERDLYIIAFDQKSLDLGKKLY
jgi:hypothetical protein